MREFGGVSLDDTNAWLAANGWQQASVGRGGWMWINKALDRQVGVVRNLGSDEQAQSGLVSRLAAAHNREIADVRRELQFWGIDVTYVRAANDVVIADTIPLNAGAAMIMLLDCDTLRTGKSRAQRRRRRNQRAAAGVT